jgi:hypothetical protein
MPPPVAEHILYPIRRTHLEAITGPLGIWQHAAGNRPDEAFGYCTDDVARALTLDLMHAVEIGWPAVEASAQRSLRFLGEALVEHSGRFRNFRTAHGAWIETDWSEDCHGRALRALGLAMSRSPDAGFAAQARDLFLRGLPATRQMQFVRGRASALLGCVSAMEGRPSPQAHATLSDLGMGLKRAFIASAADDEWPWPDQILTYENGLLPEALIRAGAALGDDPLLRLGLSTLDWLERRQSAAGRFFPIGNDGWWPRDGARAMFDQQPIEAASMAFAAAAAFDQTREERYQLSMERAYGWFLGHNSLALPIADPETGGCHDGLSPEGVNANQGAESTVVWQMTLETVRATRKAASGSGAGSTTSTRAAAVPALAGGHS